jgi:6-phosphogluconate dehydrogenase
MKAVAAMRNQFGGHALHTAPPPGGDISKQESARTDRPQQAPEAEAAGASDGPKPSES